MPEPLDIYCIAIGGTGMAPLACLLDQLGHRLRGADGPLYPPMSTLLEDAGIVPAVGFDPANIDPAPDLVIVGNAVPRTNVEAAKAQELGLPCISMPQAVARFLLAGRRPLVIAGTHGKTTTTAMASWVWDRCGQDPGFLIGGVPIGFGRSFRLGKGPRFVIEGDEYNAAYFDRGPKFLHYRPQMLIITGAEHDHADLYPTHDALLDAFRRLLALVEPDGVVIACGDDRHLRGLLGAAGARVVTYGLGADNEVRPLGPVVSGPAGSRFAVDDGDGEAVEVRLPVPGRHNVSNALAVWAAARADGLAADAVAAALGSFRGVERRLQELATVGDITVVDDFAHHPTAVAASLGGLAERYPGRRRLAVFEPRSLTAGRSFLFDAYLEAFTHADSLVLAPIFHRARLAETERLDRDRLVTRLVAAGVDAHACGPDDDLLVAVLERLRPGDVAVTMSSGSFDGLPRRLVEALGDRDS